MSIEEVLQKYDPVRITDRLAETGFVLPDRPMGEEPYLPENLDCADSRTLRKLQAEFAAWYEYVSAQVTATSVEATVRTDAKKYIEAALGLAIAEEEGKLGTKERSSLILCDASFIRVNSALVEASALLDAHKQRLSRINKSLEVISRQMTMLLSGNQPRPEY